MIRNHSILPGFMRPGFMPLGLLLLVALTACAPEYIPHGEMTARVVRVIDGDTLIISLEGRREKVRLAGIDTPESAAPCEAERRLARAARARLEALTAASPVVTLRPTLPRVWRRDAYGRLLARVRATSPAHPGLSGPDLGAVMVTGGHARHWWPFTPKPTWCGGMS